MACGICKDERLAAEVRARAAAGESWRGIAAAVDRNRSMVWRHLGKCLRLRPGINDPLVRVKRERLNRNLDKALERATALRDKAVERGDTLLEFRASREVSKLLALQTRNAPKVAQVPVDLEVATDRWARGASFAVSGLDDFFGATAERHPWLFDTKHSKDAGVNITLEICFYTRQLIDAHTGEPVNTEAEKAEVAQ
jgi:hypothetical protein